MWDVSFFVLILVFWYQQTFNFPQFFLFRPVIFKCFFFFVFSLFASIPGPVPLLEFSISVCFVPASFHSCFYFGNPPFLESFSTTLLLLYVFKGFSERCLLPISRSPVMQHVLSSSTSFLEFFALHLPPSSFFLWLYLGNDSFRRFPTLLIQWLFVLFCVCYRYFCECYGLHSVRHNWLNVCAQYFFL